MREMYFDPSKHLTPKSWDALSDRQLAGIAYHLHNAGNDFELAILKYLMPHVGHWIVPREDAAEILSFIGKTYRTKALQSIRVGLTRFYGPNDKLGNISFGEFITADRAFDDFIETKDLKKLDRLCAILFRQKKWPWQKLDGDVRVLFDSNAIDERRWAKVPIERKLAIAVFFSGCKQALAKAFPKIFKKSLTPTAVTDKTVWLKSLHSLADGIPNYDAVLSTRLFLVMFEMTQRIEEVERLKQQR